jgi:hypothetical protein
MARGLFAVALAAVASAALASEVDPICSQILPTAEAEALAGVKPLALVGPSQVRFATGTCNYATKGKADRTLVLLVTVTRDSKQEDYEQLRKVSIGPKPAQGLGDEAFTAEGVVGFRKGQTVVSLGTFVDSASGKHRVGHAKLLEIAKLVAARI